MIYCRTASSLGSLEGTPEQAWGTPPYDPQKHIDEPCVFFGLYGLPDFYALWRHRGKKWILWTGSDIRHFMNGYWLDLKGDIRLDRHSLASWISLYCESWVENDIEWGTLFIKERIVSHVCPSFLGNVSDYAVSYGPSVKPKLYTSVSGNDFKLYGWDKIRDLSIRNPGIEFHLYGNTVPWLKMDNIIDHGRVSKERMNEEIRDMQGALRLTEFDGFSEIIAKSILMGQWPVSEIAYPHMLPVEDIGQIHNHKEPNIEGREYYLKILNKFPWNSLK